MSRRREFLWYAPLAFAALARAQQLPPKESDGPPPKDSASPPPKDSGSLPPQEGQIPLPPPEDKQKSTSDEYAFNPVKSKKAVEVGEFYFKKGDFRAAAGRFQEATKWNDGNADAWLKLGEAEEKMNDTKSARAAWTKYLQLAPQAKNAAEVKKKLEKLGQS